VFIQSNYPLRRVVFLVSVWYNVIMNTVATGRPTKLTDELLIKASSYIYGVDGKPPSWEKEGSAVPSIEGFALYLGINRDTAYAWERENDNFSDIVCDIRLMQAKILVDNGLKNQFNSSITKLMLTKHGYVEKSETDITTQGAKISGNTDTDLATRFEEFLSKQTKSK
jgi:DNA-packaging protein gp3